MAVLFKKVLKKIKQIGYGSLSVILFFIIWEVISRVGLVDTSLISRPSKVFEVIYVLIKKGELFTHIFTSLKRAGIGFLIAALTSITSGFLLGGLFKSLGNVLNPTFRLFEKINPFALFPLFILLFGIGETSKIVLIFWVSQWPIFFNTVTGLRDIDPVLIKSARSMGASKKVLFFKVILPAATPSIFTGIKVGAQIAFFMVIAAEMLGASKGLGWLAVNAQTNYQIPLLFGATLCISVLGVAINKIFSWLESLFLVWRQTAFDSGNN